MDQFPRKSIAAARWRNARLALGVLLGLSFFTTPATTLAQGNPPPPGEPGAGGAPGANSYPRQSYFSATGQLHGGNFKGALKDFDSEAVVKIGQQRWIDSICILTMQGECHYQLGHYGDALDRYTAAMQLFLHWRNWMGSARFPDDIRTAQPGQIKAVPWGASKRRVQYGDYPSTILILQGEINNNNAIRGGGIFHTPQYKPVNAIEVMRCMAVSLRRRRELLGPVAAYDTVSQQVVAALANPGTAAGHWTRALVEVQMALGYSANGNDAIAKNLYLKGLVTPSGLDHPLTSMALFELGRIELQAANFEAAAGYFFEASCAALHYPDPTIVEESFRYGHLAVTLANRAGAAPLVLPPAIAWAKKNDYAHLHASVALLAAESLSTAGPLPLAVAALADARQAIGHSSMAETRVGARFQFASAQVAYQQANLQAGDTALTAAINLQKNSSLWLWHMQLADNLIRQGNVTPRDAMKIYDSILREPTMADWLTEPLEALAVLNTPHADLYARWFAVALERRQPETAFEIADLSRRHRFFSTLAGGGRLLSLQWLLEGPASLHSQQDQLHRQDLLARYPQYKTLTEQIQQARGDLTAQPLVAADAPGLKKQTDALAQLSSLYHAQELLVRQMAASRLPANLVFPPRKTIKDLQQAMPERQAVLAYYVAGEKVFAGLLTKTNFSTWDVGSTLAVHEAVAKVLKQLGHYEMNRAVGTKQLEDRSWRRTARDLWSELNKGGTSEFARREFDELVVVPDGVLWYLPFEVLGATNSAAETAKDGYLIERTRVRYAPVLSLSIPYEDRGRKPGENMVVALGKMHPRDDAGVIQAGFDDLKSREPLAVPLVKKPLPGSMALYSSFFDRLVVYDDVSPPDGGPFQFSPIPLAAGTSGSTLEHWFSLPWQGPDQVILPSYHTAAENSLKGLPPAVAGSDVFLPVFGLLASGSRTVLLSRWRTGGQVSFDLVNEFVQELPHGTASDAWQRSVLLANQTPLIPGNEPRLEIAGGANIAPTAAHPFFWAGYLLADVGVSPRKKDEKLEGIAPPRTFIPDPKAVLAPVPMPQLK